MLNFVGIKRGRMRRDNYVIQRMKASERCITNRMIVNVKERYYNKNGNRRMDDCANAALQTDIEWTMYEMECAAF